MFDFMHYLHAKAEAESVLDAAREAAWEKYQRALEPLRAAHAAGKGRHRGIFDGDPAAKAEYAAEVARAEAEYDAVVLGPFTKDSGCAT